MGIWKQWFDSLLWSKKPVGVVASVALWMLDPRLADAADLKPWYERALELRPRAAYVYEGFKKVDTGKGVVPYDANCNGIELGISTSLEPYAVEIELSCFDTPYHSFYFNDLNITGRYQLANQEVGDDYTLTAGLTYTIASGIGKTDISQFFHGGMELEFHLAYGIEDICWDVVTSRWWGVAGLGTGNIGYPWIRLDGGYEWLFAEESSVQLFAHALWGTGGRSLVLTKHFNSYAHIQHRSIDLGLSAKQSLGDGIIELTYARRLYAKNFPMQVNTIRLQYTYPFGL